METILRLSIATGVFLIMIGWERFTPRRTLIYSRKQRWPTNLGLAALNMLIMRFSIGGLAVVAAIDADNHAWGLFNQTELPLSAQTAIGILLLDLAIYLQHILSHKWSFLWRFHQVHHSDIEIDASSAIRFHPIEIMLSMLYKGSCVYLIGIPAAAVISFEILLNAAATFNHSNIKIPYRIETVLRGLIITPDMHRIHHSIVKQEMDSNYGFSISVWDRIFKTYTPKASLNQKNLKMGLKEHRAIENLGFISMLKMPFMKQ